MPQLGFLDRTGRVNLAVRRRAFGQEGLVVSIYVCVCFFFYTAGCQLDRVRSAQPVISMREGERYKKDLLIVSPCQ